MRKNEKRGDFLFLWSLTIFEAFSVERREVKGGKTKKKKKKVFVWWMVCDRLMITEGCGSAKGGDWLGSFVQTFESGVVC